MDGWVDGLAGNVKETEHGKFVIHTYTKQRWWKVTYGDCQGEGDDYTVSVSVSVMFIVTQTRYLFFLLCICMYVLA